MWFWTVLNASLVWLLDRLFKPQVTFGLLVAPIAVLIFYYFWSPIRDLVNRAEDGQIVVNSPTIYTRQRLVNDRLLQTAWLQEQLEAADRINSEAFHIIDEVQSRSVDQGLRLALGNSDTANSSSQREGPVKIIPTTAALFHAKNSYREDVRAELMEAQLDDRHDILGNTMYRLSFSATLLAGSRNNALAGIKVALRHDPKAGLDEEQKRRKSDLTALRSRIANKILPRAERIELAELERLENLTQLYHDDYSQLYEDWLRHMQRIVGSSIDAAASSIGALQPEQRIRLLYMRFVTERVCEFLLNRMSLSDTISPDCEPERRQARQNINAATKFIDEYLANYVAVNDEMSREYFGSELQYALTLTRDAFSAKLPPEAFSAIYLAARNLCRTGGGVVISGQAVIPLSQLPLPPELTKGTKEDIGCPSSADSPAQRVLAAVVLYEELFSLLTQPDPPSSSDSKSLLAALRDRRTKNCRERGMVGDASLCGFPNQQAATRCFAADFIKWYLNSSVRPSEVVKDWERLNYFLRLEIVGRELGQCEALVFPHQSVVEKVAELRYHLNKDTEAFSYSVAPKNLSEQISSTSEVRDAFEMIARYQFSIAGKESEPLAEAFRKRSEQVQAVMAHPIVVGYGSGKLPVEPLVSPNGKERSTVVRETRFGWVIAPRIHGGHDQAQIDGQYSLTAVISVPSWWRSVEIELKTCWVSREELRGLAANSGEDIEFCTSGSHPPDRRVIRLPGAIQELSRKLGFEVVKEPNLWIDSNVQELHVGEKGSLVLRGDRLWRSTAVTLGSQTATSIAVLPNMNGIIASFDCVLPQGNGRKDEREGRTGVKISQVKAKVWTSEGETEPMPVDLIWPDDEVAKKAAEQFIKDLGDEKKKRRSIWCQDKPPASP